MSQRFNCRRSFVVSAFRRPALASFHTKIAAANGAQLQLFTTIAHPCFKTCLMSNTASKKMDMTEGDIQSTLTRMTVPMLFGMITLMSFNLVDTFFISMLGTKELAAVSFTFPVTFTVISLAIGLEYRHFGTDCQSARQWRQFSCQSRRAGRALVVGLSGGGFVGWLGYLLMDPLFRLLGAKDDTLPFIHDYMSWWFFGAVFLITPMIGNAVLACRR